METPKENCTLANSEDLDERLHNATFHQNLHRFIKDTRCSEIYTQYFLKIITCELLPLWCSVQDTDH